MCWKVAGPSEYLAITGQGIDDIRLAKKAWVLPGQQCSRFDVSPVNYTFEVQAMSAEMLPFVLPAVFTIGPYVDDMDSLLLYAKLKLSNHVSNHINGLVQGVIEGETRVLAASMTMEEIFKGTNEFNFKKEVFEKVQLELNQFGLLIYYANVKQIVDVRGHEYFSYLGQKTQMEVANDQTEASPSLNSAMAAAGDADSAASGIYPARPPSPCDGHGNTEACSHCMYSKYQPEQVFQKKLSGSDIQRKGSYRFYLPTPHAARFNPPANEGEVTVYDVQMNGWPMSFRKSGGRAYLARGWSGFVLAKNLREGDVITFYELNCKRGMGRRVFMIGISRKQCIQILGAPII